MDYLNGELLEATDIWGRKKLLLFGVGGEKSRIFVIMSRTFRLENIEIRNKSNCIVLATILSKQCSALYMAYTAQDVYLK